MTEPATQAFFIDANVFVYYLDPNTPQHLEVCTTLEEILNSDTAAYTSHHVIEEVLRSIFLITRSAQMVQAAVHQLASMDEVVFVEPEASFDFARKYTRLFHSVSVGLNDCLLLQLMLDSGITHLYTYDEKLARAAIALGLHPIPSH